MDSKHGNEGCPAERQTENDKSSSLPAHIAIIMDGNGRWAEKRGLPRLSGHKAGVDRIHSVARTFNDVYHTRYLTLYGFSTENWNRPQEEVKGLFNILEENIDEEAAKLHRENVKILHLGRMIELPQNIQNAINRAITLTSNNSGMVLSLAFNYGGRTEIVDAVRQLIINKVDPAAVDEKSFALYLYTAGMPDVDLVIRTGCEIRISNFLLWQAAYAEYYFTRVLWPDFTPR